MKNSLQVLVAEFNRSHKNKIKTHTRVLDLASEVGEVCKLAFSENINIPVDSNKWEEELADALYSLLSLMSEMEIDAERALKLVIKKYENRIIKNGQMSSGR